MPTHVALLRGINVGRRNRVARADTARIAAALERAIAKHLGVRPAVVVLTRAELAQAVADNPFPDEPNPRLDGRHRPQLGNRE